MSSSSSSQLAEVSFSTVLGTGCLTLVLASLLAYALFLQQQTNKKKNDSTNGYSTETTAKTTPTKTTKEKNAQDNNVDMSQYPGGSISIYFATQTGTAEAFARDIEREGKEKGFLIHVVDLEDVMDATDIAPRCLFLVATYGEGEAPDHAVSFVQKLQSMANMDSIILPTTDSTEQHQQQQDANGGTVVATSSSSLLLQHVECAVFGLGNRQYDHYNAMGNFFYVALQRSGAKAIVSLGLGDDNVDLEADFEAWKDGIWWPAVTKLYLPALQDENGNVSSTTTKSLSKESFNKLPDCPLQVTYYNNNNTTSETTTNIILPTNPNYDLASEQIHSSSRHYFTAWECPVTVVRELQTKTTSDNNKKDSTVHVEVDISRAQRLSDSSSTNGTTTNSSSTDNVFTYTTADNLGVLPVNDTTVVETVAQKLGYDLDAIFSVSAAPGHEWHGAPFPMPCTIRECLTRYCDVTSAPRRSDLKLLASYCSNPLDRSALLRMAAKEGRTEYKEKILDQYTGLIHLLHLCPSLQLPLEHFLNVCPPLQTRFFTIASSSSLHPQTIHLTVAVTQHERSDGSMFHGVCSTHLSKCGKSSGSETPATTTIRVFHRPSSFRLPTDPSRPILMVGPGTGIAPMRAFLQERLYQRDRLQLPVGKNILYFGCKHASQDYIYQSELEEFVKSKILTHLRVAHSRDQAEKIYVQHLLQQNATETWKLISEEGVYIYVCGGVKMGQDVMEALKEIVSTQGGMTILAAKDYLTKMSHDGRYVQELWA